MAGRAAERIEASLDAVEVEPSGRVRRARSRAATLVAVYAGGGLVAVPAVRDARAGFVVDGEVFDTPHFGPHLRMALDLD